MTKISSYRDLKVWQLGKEICLEVYKLTSKFPKEEQYGLSQQMKRAAVSIPSNIAEGFGRYLTNDYVRFLRYSIGSLFELNTQSEIAFELEYINNAEFESHSSECMQLEKMLNSLIRKLKQSN